MFVVFVLKVTRQQVRQREIHLDHKPLSHNWHHRDDLSGASHSLDDSSGEVSFSIVSKVTIWPRALARNKGRTVGLLSFIVRVQI